MIAQLGHRKMWAGADWIKKLQSIESYYAIQCVFQILTESKQEMLVEFKTGHLSTPNRLG